MLNDFQDGSFPRVAVSVVHNEADNCDGRKSTVRSVRGTVTRAKCRKHGETSYLRWVGVPEHDRNFLTHRTLSQELVQARGDGSVSQSVGRTPDGSGHM